jgi:IS5 family transposase
MAREIIVPPLCLNINTACKYYLQILAKILRGLSRRKAKRVVARSLSLFLSRLIGTSRIRLKAHTVYPEMHSVKKENKWHFGERSHIGTGAGTGYIHSMEVTAANVGERDVVPQLVREGDRVSYGDAGYTGLLKRPEFQEDEHLSSMEHRVNSRNWLYWKSNASNFDWDRYAEYQKSRVRSKVEYAFLVVKRIFGYRKVRYRRIAKNESHAYALRAYTHLYLLAQSGWRGVC